MDQQGEFDFGDEVTSLGREAQRIVKKLETAREKVASPAKAGHKSREVSAPADPNAERLTTRCERVELSGRLSPPATARRVRIQDKRETIAVLGEADKR